MIALTLPSIRSFPSAKSALHGEFPIALLSKSRSFVISNSDSSSCDRFFSSAVMSIEVNRD